VDISTFATIATAASLNVIVVDALPYGGWADINGSRDLAATFDIAALAEEDGEGSASEALESILETAIVVATDKDGNVKGAWCHCGWFIGNRTVTIDAAYERVIAE